jgi:hypothetical protein
MMTASSSIGSKLIPVKGKPLVGCSTVLLGGCAVCTDGGDFGPVFGTNVPYCAEAGEDTAQHPSATFGG